MLFNLNKIDSHLYRSSAPSEGDVRWLHDKLGIRRFVSLDQAAGNKIAPVVQDLGAEHIMLPIDGSRPSIINFLAKIDGALDTSKKTLLHCLHGKDRSGLAAALYRVKENGWSPEKAIAEANKFGFCLGIDPDMTKIFHDLIHKSSPDVEEDVSEAYDQDYNYGGGYGSFSYPGASIEDLSSWAPRYDSHTFMGENSIASPGEIEAEREGGGGVAEWLDDDGDTIVGLPDSSTGNLSAQPGIPGAGFSLPAVTWV